MAQLEGGKSYRCFGASGRGLYDPTCAFLAMVFSMRILIVSWYFPPSNTIGAVRVGTLAKHLVEQGHEVKVLTVKDPPYAQTLPRVLPSGHVVAAPWKDVNAAPKRAAVWIKGMARRFRSTNGGDGNKIGSVAVQAPSSGPGPLSRFYMNLINFPDSRIGWLWPAMSAGRALLADWRPDLIFASGPPFTGLLLAHRLAKRSRIPLVVEFRDRWSDDPYAPPPAWRGYWERVVEGRIIRAAAGLVTVSEPWADTYRHKFGKPTIVVYNGYDPELCASGDPVGSLENPVLRIVYTGGIYPGRRDPSPLFEAVGRLPDAPNRIEIDFHGTNENHVFPLAEKYGVRDVVSVYPRVDHDKAIHLQLDADVLFLMQWNDPREQGNVPGKFFEYLGARRPILCLGLEDGVPATLIRQRGAGFFSNDPAAIAEQLEAWIAIKRSTGAVPASPERARAGFSRYEQFAKLEPFFTELLATGAGAMAPQLG